MARSAWKACWSWPPRSDTVGWPAADPAVLPAAGSVLPPQAPAGLPQRLLSPQPPADPSRQLADALGAELRPGPVPGLGDLHALLAVFRTVQAAEAWRARGRWICGQPRHARP